MGEGELTMDGSIRLATQEDSDALLEIYAPYVRDTDVSFEIDVPGKGEFKRRVADILEHYPYLVYVRGDKIIGYAYASRHRERAAYRYDADVSIYIRQGEHGAGIGTALYDRLFNLLIRQGFYNVYAGITVPNEKSYRFHIKQGFAPVGTYHRAGYKFDRWVDVVWLEKAIGDFSVPPKEILPVGDVRP